MTPAKKVAGSTQPAEPKPEPEDTLPVTPPDVEPVEGDSGKGPQVEPGTIPSPDDENTAPEPSNVEPSVDPHTEEDERVDTATNLPSAPPMAPSADTVGAVGNRFGQSSTAAANFVKDFQGQAEVHVLEAAKLLDQAQYWAEVRDEVRAQEERDEEQRRKDEEEKQAADERQARILDALEKIADAKAEG